MRSVVIRCVAEHQSWARKVEDFMTTDHLDTVRPEEDVQEVMRKMERSKVRRVLVVGNGRLVGIIAPADLARKEGPRKPLRVEWVLERISAPLPATL